MSEERIMMVDGNNEEPDAILQGIFARRKGVFKTAPSRREGVNLPRQKASHHGLSAPHERMPDSKILGCVR